MWYLIALGLVVVTLFLVRWRCGYNDPMRKPHELFLMGEPFDRKFNTTYHIRAVRILPNYGRGSGWRVEGKFVGRFGWHVLDMRCYDEAQARLVANRYAKDGLYTEEEYVYKRDKTYVR